MGFADAEIGSVLLEQEKYPLALERYEHSYAINKSLGRQLSQAYNQQNRGKVLWQLGRFDEARKALQEATAIATEKGYKQLLPDIQLTQAEVFLAERRLPEARSTAEKAIAGAGNQCKEVAAEAKSVFGHAQVLSGSRQGRVLCENSLQMAQELGDAALISRMMMKLAEALLEMGDAQNALPLAAQAQERFSRAGQLESEWRAF